LIFTSIFYIFKITKRILTTCLIITILNKKSKIKKKLSIFKLSIFIQIFKKSQSEFYNTSKDPQHEIYFQKQKNENIDKIVNKNKSREICKNNRTTSINEVCK